MIERFTISRDDTIYEAFPDVALTASGNLVCVFAECTHHADRSYTRIMVTTSMDRGRTWSAKRPLTEATHGIGYYNCARITALRDGRLAVLVDKIYATGEDRDPEAYRNLLFFSADEGGTWSEALETPARGIVPDRLLELTDGRWLLSCHGRQNGCTEPISRNLVQRLWVSDDQGATWSGPIIVGQQEGLNLCEASILSMGGEVLVAFHRENSGKGWDCYKTISHDNGASWSGPIAFPLPACHRPVAGWLRNGQILITHRFMQGGKGWTGWWTQNLFAALTDRESALAPSREEAHTRILPLDFDRSPQSDTGYSGWVQFEDGEIYVVNYILDDALKAQIRGYSLHTEDFILS